MIYYARGPELETQTHVSGKFWKGVAWGLGIQAIAVMIVVWWWNS